MSDNSRIEWTEATWNPTTGCTKVSPGCDHCYAEGMFNRFNGPGAFDTVKLRPERLEVPIRWRRPRRVFVNSMSDLFHADVPDDFIARTFAVMATAGNHTYQVLTKRHARMRSLLNSPRFREDVAHHWFELYDKYACRRQFVPTWADHWPLPNVWLGVSVEDQHWANLRIPALLNTPAAVRFLSCEPLLGPVGLRDEWMWATRGVHWVIVGGESGHGARPMDAEWATSLRDQCATAGVPFFMKQAGAVLAREWGCSDRKGHNPAEWPEPFPREFPATVGAAA